jgi:tetratricopeptide (TPR) repeat protein
LGVLAGAVIILVGVLAYGLWPRDLDRGDSGPGPDLRPEPAPEEVKPGPLIKRREIAVLKPEVPKDCPHARDWVTNTVRNAMEEPLFRFQGVFVVSEIGALARTELAEAVADELLGATVTCHPGHLTIELRRQDGNGNLLVPRRVFEIDISQLGRSDIIHNNVIQLYEAFEMRSDIPPRGQARPEDVDAFQRLTQGYWMSELSLEQVLDELEGIRRSSPAFLDAYILAAELLMHRANPGDFENAWQLMQEAKVIDPDWHPVLSRLFTIALARHDIDAAENILKEIEALDQGAGFTYYLRGLSREDAQDTRGARDAMKTAAGRNPSWPILYHLAKLNMAVCDIEEARQVLDELLTHWPNNRSARTLKWKLVGRIDPSAAAGQYEPLPLPREPAESFNQAINLMTLGKYREAKSLILQTMEQHTDDRADLGAIYSLAELEKLLGEADSAQARFAQVLSRVPVDEHQADVMIARAMVLAHQGHFEEARQAVESALRREDMEIYYSAAAVYAMAGDADEAARWAERALDCGYAREWFHYPWFDTIRQMPQFRERIGTDENSPAR